MDDLTGIREAIAKIVSPLTFELTEVLDAAEGEPPELREKATAMRDLQLAAALAKADQIIALFADHIADAGKMIAPLQAQVEELTEDLAVVRAQLRQVAEINAARAQAAEAQALALREAGEKALGGFRRVASILSNSELHEHTRICDARDEAIFARQALEP